MGQREISPSVYEYCRSPGCGRNWIVEDNKTTATDDLPMVIPHRSGGVSVLNFQDRPGILQEMRLSGIDKHKYIGNGG